MDKSEERLEINGYLSDYSVDSFSEQETEDTEEEESDYESDNSEYDELFENKNGSPRNNSINIM